MAAARKRPRESNTATNNNTNEDHRAECPFSVKVAYPRDGVQKKKKRRRTDGGEEDDVENKIHVQMSPFAPCGKFKTNDSMDLHYQVMPAKRWTEMTRYNSFVLNGVKYFSEGFIYVANDSSVERQKAAGGVEIMEPRKKSDDDWVARILEIRASDEHHVYARVYWMYWPDELPQGTHDGRRTVRGRQPYHGANELIASNHMDIINVVSVTSQAQVKQWYEENDDEIQQALYWRQAFDIRTYELSTVELVCSCNTPAHPDNLLVGCTTESCKKWMHEQCITEEALKETYNRLGTDKPHIDPASITNSTDEDEEKPPASPVVNGTAQQSIDVADGESDTVQVNTNDSVNVKQSEDEDAPGAPEDFIAEDASVEPPSKSESETPTKTTTTIKLTTRKPGRPRKKLEVNGNSSKPWEGLFEVTLKMAEQGPPLLEFKDLRVGIVGGERTWTEPVKCLVCGNQVN